MVTAAFAISACAGIALLLAMVLSSLSGTLIPLMFKKLKVDPAAASGPLITTINDLVAVVTYYGLEWILIVNVFSCRFINVYNCYIVSKNNKAA